MKNLDISIIAAIDDKRGLGKDGILPWKLPLDLRRFRTLTMGTYVLVGRVTWEKMESKLEGRSVILVTKNINYISTKPITFLARSIDSVLQYAHFQGIESLFVIGGESVYKQTINLANKLFITRVHGVFDCDTFFPEINLNEWRIISQEKRNENDINFTFERYIRILYKNKGCAD